MFLYIINCFLQFFMYLCINWICMAIDVQKMNALIAEGETYSMTTVEAHLESAGFVMATQIPTMH